MYDSQVPWVNLFDATLEYGGTDIYSGLLQPWLEQHRDERQWLSDFSERTNTNWANATHEDLCHLYAISRVTSILLLRFQLGRGHGGAYAGPPVSLEEFRLFHQALGLHVPEQPSYRPFFHEIVGVEQTQAKDAAVALIGEVWPALMLGSMMFCRAGVVVSSGADHVVKEVAENSLLHWSFWRRDRPCEDLSHGWGHNSQWRTVFRRDYMSSDGYHYNVDAGISLNTVKHGIDEAIGVPAMVELVRHRCAIQTPLENEELFPYRYSFVEGTGSSGEAINKGLKAVVGKWLGSRE